MAVKYCAPIAHSVEFHYFAITQILREINLNIVEVQNMPF